MLEDNVFKSSKEQLLNALHRFKRRYPAAYKYFFLYELEKPYSPFDSEAIIYLSKEDEELLKK